MKRGNLLWTGSRMMLAEHRQLLNERLTKGTIDNSLNNELDEQQLEEWQEALSEAIANNRKVNIIYMPNKQSINGYIVDWNVEQGTIYLQENDDIRTKLSIKKIIDFRLE